MSLAKDGRPERLSSISSLEGNSEIPMGPQSHGFTGSHPSMSVVLKRSLYLSCLSAFFRACAREHCSGDHLLVMSQNSPVPLMADAFRCASDVTVYDFAAFSVIRQRKKKSRSQRNLTDTELQIQCVFCHMGSIMLLPPDTTIS